MTWDTLPNDIKIKIYEFDPTYLEIFRRNVINEMRSINHLYSLYLKLDRGFSVRNWEVKNWGIVPRYYDTQNNRVIGCYIRKLIVIREPL